METAMTPAQPTMRRIEQRAVEAGDAARSEAVKAIEAALAARPAIEGRLDIRIDERNGFIVDCPARRIEPLGGAADCRFYAAPKDLLRVSRGEVEPRHAILFGQIQVQEGPTSVAVAFFDHLAGATMARRLETDRPLPRPTRDWDRARKDLTTFGYALVEGALSQEEVAALRQRTIEQAAGEVDAGVATLSSAAQHLWTLLNKGRIYHDLLLNPLVDAFVPDLLGAHFILNSITGSIALPGNAPATMHIDQSNVQPPARAIPMGLNILWFLDDVTDANGGTRLLPGSHLADIAPADPFDPADTIAAEGPAGTALLLDSRVWHSVGRNTTDRRRHVLVTYFNRSFMRAHENHFLSLRPELEPTLHEKVRVMLGYRCTLGLGAIEAPVEGRFSRRVATPVGELEGPAVSDARRAADAPAGPVTPPPAAPPAPSPTADWDRARHDLRTFGHALVRDALTPEAVKALRERVVAQAAGERATGMASVSGGAQTLWNLLNKGRVFHDLLLHPLIEAFAPTALGDHPVLAGIVSIIAARGGGAMPLHVDQAHVQAGVEFQVGLDILWFLDDVSAANGGVRIVPGSHRGNLAPSGPSGLDRMVAAEARAGAALLLDSRVWRATGSNRSTEPRHVVVTSFSRAFLRTKENYFLSMRPEVEASLDDRVRVMCGYRCTASVGGVEGPIEGKLYRRPASLVGELRPAGSQNISSR
jgi:ectoine hydroxylase-related dioxygenase (phytanoyl-CoA dioxygenase family)